jgi:hypothetical protein
MFNESNLPKSRDEEKGNIKSLSGNEVFFALPCLIIFAEDTLG